MERKHYVETIQRYFRTHPIVAILGPRQCGKTTLARYYFEKHNGYVFQNYFDLENSTDLERLKDPQMGLQQLSGLIVIDEIQRRPELFTTLRVLVDNNSDQRFLILGSASRELIRQSSESLAGRIAYMELTPFNYSETKTLEKLWARGGFPRSYLSPSELDSYEWREFYISTFLEQDIPNLGIQIPAVTLRRFWTMLSHYHGSVLNTSELARAFGVTDKTIKRYLDILSGTFMIRQLQPWHENIKKRQVKSPKIYFRDSGLLHALLKLKDIKALDLSPKIGASWEGFALEEVIRLHKARPHECFFWAVHAGGELDLLLMRDNQRLGFEFKYSSAPKLTNSMRTAMADLSLTRLVVLYPGKVNYPLADGIEVKGLEGYLAADDLV